MLKLSDFKSMFDLVNFFSSEEKCIEYLEKIRWNNNIVSPYDSKSKVYKCHSGYCCKNTGKRFNVKTNTIFENTKIPLRKWFVAIW